MHLTTTLSVSILLWFITPNSTTFQFNHVGPLDRRLIKKYCGLAGDKQPSFKVRGLPADISKFPWVVQLDINIEITTYYHEQVVPTVHIEENHCSGVLISNRHILTAAHCLFDLYEWLGEDNIEVIREERTKIQAMEHKIKAHIGGVNSKDYNVKDGGYFSEAQNEEQIAFYDFAILELEKDLSSQKIKQGIYRPICFTRPHKHPPLIDHETVVAGYGGLHPVLHYQVTNSVACPIGDEGPINTCFGYVAELGDSGTAYFQYDRRGKAHIKAIYSSHRGEVDIGVDCEERDEKTPLNRIETELLLKYSTRDK